MDFTPLAGAGLASIAATWLVATFLSAAPILVGLATALVAVASVLLLHDEATPLLRALPTGPGRRHARRAVAAGFAGTLVLVAVVGLGHLHGVDTSAIFMPSLALFAAANAVYAITLPRSDYAAEIGAAAATAWLIATFILPSHPHTTHLTEAWRAHPTLTTIAAGAATLISYTRGPLRQGRTRRGRRAGGRASVDVTRQVSLRRR